MKYGNKELCWSSEATTAFVNMKEALANTTLPLHPKPDVQTTIMCYSTDTVVETVLQQHTGEQWCPTAHFSKETRTCRDPLQHFSQVTPSH